MLTLFVAGCGDVKFENKALDPTSQLSSTSVVDSFTVPNNNAVDILFVIDNSGSMRIEQQSISTKLSSFISKVTNLDWRIAITSTDMTSSTAPANGLLVNMVSNQKYLDVNVLDYAAIFEQKVQLGSSGSGTEEGVRASLTALMRNEANWMRPDAQLAVILLSDEDECSNQSASCMGTENDPDNLLQQIRTTYGDRKNFTFNSIVIQDEACRQVQGSQLDRNGNPILAYIGYVYKYATDITSGINGSICSSDYGQELGAIGDRVQLYSGSFMLQCKPVNGEVTVKRDSDGSVVATHTDNNRVIFDELLVPNTNLTISYKCP